MEFILGAIDVPGGVMDFTNTFKQFAAGLLLAAPFAVAAQQPMAVQPSKPPVVQGSPGSAAAATTPGTPAAIPPTPANPVALPADEPDMKMSEEELAKQRAEEEAVVRKKAAEDAAAERQRQREARIARCVIKMVMTDEEIDFCKVAYRE
jgi:hypothetical protein